jgi:hypothetical protein
MVVTLTIKMEVAKLLVSSVRAWRDNLGRAFVVITLIVCVYQIWIRWREKRAIERNVRGKVVLITGASSGLGEGTHFWCRVCSL